MLDGYGVENGNGVGRSGTVPAWLVTPNARSVIPP